MGIVNNSIHEVKENSWIIPEPWFAINFITGFQLVMVEDNIHVEIILFDYSRTWNFQSYWCSFFTLLYTCQLWRIHEVCQKHCYVWILSSWSNKPIFAHEVVAISMIERFFPSKRSPMDEFFWLLLLLLFFSAWDFFFVGFSIFGNSFRICRTTPI